MVVFTPGGSPAALGTTSADQKYWSVPSARRLREEAVARGDSAASISTATTTKALRAAVFIELNHLGNAEFGGIGIEAERALVGNSLSLHLHVAKFQCHAPLRLGK